MSSHVGIKFSLGCRFVWSLPADFDRSKRGQAFGLVARIAIQTTCNMESCPCSGNLLLGPEHCHRRFVFVELHHLPVVRLRVGIIVYYNFSFLLCQDLYYASPKTSIGPRCFFARTANSSRNAIEHCSIQKVGVWGFVDSGNIALLLSSVFCSYGIGEFHWFDSICCTWLEVYNNHRFLEFIFKPISLLLEDQRSETSSERNNRTMSLLIRLGFPYLLIKWSA